MARFQAHLPSLPKTRFLLSIRCTFILSGTQEVILAEAKSAENGKYLFVQPGPHSSKATQKDYVSHGSEVSPRHRGPLSLACCGLSAFASCLSSVYL